MKALSLMLSAIVTIIPVGTATGSTGGEASLPMEAILHMPPQQQIEYVKKKVAKQAALPRADAAILDTTPPTLIAFNASTSVNAARAGTQLLVNLTVSDNLSGIRIINFNVKGPSGQWVSGNQYFYSPLLKNWKGKIAVTFTPYVEAGVWTVVSMQILDQAGNWEHIDTAQLSALGNNQFSVASNKLDLVLPTLISGQIRTPVISLSSSPKGTDLNYALVGVKLRSSDTGNTVVAGVKEVWANFCLPDESACFSVYDVNNTQKLKNYSFYAGNSLCEEGNTDCIGQSVPVGEYWLRGVSISDHAGNHTYLESTQFGGATDFSTLFPSTSIDINP